MTPDDQAITEHLATEICGSPYHAHHKPRKFDPIHDPRDCAMVIEKFCAKGCEVVPHIYHGQTRASAITALGTFSAIAPSWTRAVCEAIGRASGWKEGE